MPDHEVKKLIICYCILYYEECVAHKNGVHKNSVYKTENTKLITEKTKFVTWNIKLITKTSVHNNSMHNNTAHKNTKLSILYYLHSLLYKTQWDAMLVFKYFNVFKHPMYP